MSANDMIALWLAKADDSLEAARALIAADHVSVAASRAYYAMFYAATAALLSEGKRFTKHAAVIGEFNRTFVRPGILKPDMFKALQRAFDLRSEGDYELLAVEREEAQSVIEDAARFIEQIKGHLLRRPDNG